MTYFVRVMTLVCCYNYTPAYEVYRGYIVFAFSVYMFVCVCVCVCVCVFVNFFLSKISRKLLDLGF